VKGTFSTLLAERNDQWKTQQYEDDYFSSHDGEGKTNEEKVGEDEEEEEERIERSQQRQVRPRTSALDSEDKVAFDEAKVDEQQEDEEDSDEDEDDLDP